MVYHLVRLAQSSLEVVPHNLDIRLRFVKLAGDDLPRISSFLIGFERSKKFLVFVRPDRRRAG